MKPAFGRLKIGQNGEKRYQPAAQKKDKRCVNRISCKTGRGLGV